MTFVIKNAHLRGNGWSERGSKEYTVLYIKVVTLNDGQTSVGHRVRLNLDINLWAILYVPSGIAYSTLAAGVFKMPV